MAEGNLALGTYTGQFGFLLVEGKNGSARYDQEFFLAIHHWETSFVPMVETMRSRSANAPLISGSDVGYRYATINGHMLGAGESLRVKQGQRVLMRLLNASATENVVLALPSHSFTVIAMDGNPVPTQKVEVLSLAVAERIDAIVEMNTPGQWVLGSVLEQERTVGLGVVVEYAGTSGAPVWKDPPASSWDYTQFGKANKAPEPDKSFEPIFRDIGPMDGSPFDTWTINGKAWPHERCHQCYAYGFSCRRLHRQQSWRYLDALPPAASYGLRLHDAGEICGLSTRSYWSAVCRNHSHSIFRHKGAKNASQDWPVY